MATSKTFYNILGLFSDSKKEFKEYMENEMNFYKKLADTNKGHIKRINPDKLAKITRKYFPMGNEGIQGRI